jgi:leader peptidase (prepilin peptidase)/N-methyltransferase
MTHPFLLFLFGLLFGSFANVCAWRIPRGESIVFPGSHCPACGRPIPWFRNIPLLSYLVLRGRCADCGVRISPQYPIVEAVCGVLFAAQGFLFPPGISLLLGLVLSFALLTLSVIDLHHQIIPDTFSLGLLAVGLASAAWNSTLPGGWAMRLLWSASGAALGFGFLLLLAWGGEKVFKKEAMGGGDIKLMAAVGAFMGWKGVFTTLFIGSSVGTVWVLLMMIRGRLARRDYLPFGPFLALGAWISWAGGEKLSSFLTGFR